MKITRKLAAVILAVIMALSMPLVALAEGADANFTLTVSTTSCFAGMSYDVVASITDASKADATGNTKLTWSISSSQGTATITSKNNYSAKINEDNKTYTVTETASFTMPDVAGAEVTITAKLGSRTKTAPAVALQAIESYKVNFENNDHAYYDETNNTIYIDRKSSKTSDAEFMNVSISDINPSANDDNIIIGSSGFKFEKFDADSTGSGSYHLTFASDATGKGTLGFSTESGKTPKNYNLQCCVPLDSYKLNVKYDGETKATQFDEVKEEGDYPANGLTAVAGKGFTVSISKGNSEANDEMRYVLYTDKALTNKALDKYYSVSNNECAVNIDVAGTYYLVCKNYSCDNGKLTRDTLGRAIVAVTVNKAYPIQKIDLYKLDEDNNKTSEKLNNLTLFTNASTAKSTYALANSVTVNPIDNTDSIYYSSSNDKVAKVDSATGLITAVAKGSTTVWVRSADNPEAIASVDVEVKIGVKSLGTIATAGGITSIPSGHVAQFVVPTIPAVVDDAIYWSSSKPDVLEINPTTGVATAKAVTEKTPVEIIATTESGISQRTPFNVVPAIRAKSVKLSASSASATATEEKSGAYTVYSDYNKSGLLPFTVFADVQSNSGETSNDELLWRVTYDNGVGLSFEEAAAEGYIRFTKNSEISYDVTPLKTGLISITCTATTNVTAPQSGDPFDLVMLKLKDTATSIKVVNEGTGADAAGTIYNPIGATAKLTVKTSTADNDKTADPPAMEITSGAEYVNVTSAVSDDGEGITYSIKGLSYGVSATKIKFSSISGSVSKTITFYIRNDLASAEVKGVDSEVAYTGKDIKFADLELFVNGSSLDTAKYSVSYANNKNVGTATITLTGKAEYQGSTKVINFEITPLSLAGAEVADIKDQTLSAKTLEVNPSPAVKLNGTTLKKDRDYTLSYSNNKRAGTGTVTVIGTGNYSGTASKTFKITDDINKCAIAAIAVQTYSGKYLKPALSVKYYGKALTLNRDYTVEYTNNLNVGTASVKIKGIGNYYGTYSTSFIIKPKKQKIKSVKKAKKALTIKWTAHTNIAGYQVQYALDKKFKKSKKTVNIASGTTSYKASKLKSKKTYYVRVRSYAVINGVKVYGAWSATKKSKTK